jgi:hypothetical protein
MITRFGNGGFKADRFCTVGLIRGVHGVEDTRSQIGTWVIKEKCKYNEKYRKQSHKAEMDKEVYFVLAPSYLRETIEIYPQEHSGSSSKGR